jgi:hypothetical protein
MNPLNPTTVSRIDFKRALRLKVHKELNIDFNDLPDIVCIDDHWYEGMDERDAIIALEGIIEDIEMELDPKAVPRTINAPLYSIDE